MNAAVEARPSAIQGQGLFARRRFEAGERVIEYVGERISKSESLRRCQLNNVCIFYLDEQWDLDGSVEANRARFINHSCEPNCSARLLEGGIWIVAERPIEAGEEVTFDYGYDLEDYRNYPCSCGAGGCRGYIVAEELMEPDRGI